MQKFEYSENFGPVYILRVNFDEINKAKENQFSLKHCIAYEKMYDIEKYVLKHIKDRLIDVESEAFGSLKKPKNN